MKPELLKILERVRMSRHVPAAAPGAGTPETASERHVPDVPAVPVENRQGGNLHRRHLDATQRAVVADRLATMIRGTNRFTVDAQVCASTPAPIMTQEAAAEALTRPSAFPAGTSGTSGTPHNSAVSSVPAADPGAGTSRDRPEPEPAPRFRAWRARFADDRTMTVLNPAGMDRAEALAAVDRWPGCTVEPLLASRC